MALIVSAVMLDAVGCRWMILNCGIYIVSRKYRKITGLTRIDLVGALEHEWIILPFSWEIHTPNWRTHIFQRGGSTTNQLSCERVLFEHGKMIYLNLKILYSQMKNQIMRILVHLCGGCGTASIDQMNSVQNYGQCDLWASEDHPISVSPVGRLPSGNQTWLDLPLIRHVPSYEPPILIN